MATKKQAEYLALLCRKVAGLSKVVISGPNADELRTLCWKISNKITSEIEPETEDGILIVDNGDVDVVAKSKRRKHRTMPAGSFGFRKRTVEFHGQKFTVNSIAEGVCAIFNFLKKKENGKVPRTDVAKAIQAAYPENTYGEHRVDTDLKKWLDRKFTCQKPKDEENESSDDGIELVV